MKDLANSLGLNVKTEAFTLNDWDEFYRWHQEVNKKDYKYNGEYIEGFVVEDSAGLMIKLKLTYYNFWKFMRIVAQSTLKYGYFKDTATLTEPEANLFYGWIKKKRNSLFAEGKLDSLPRNIIHLRKLFYEEKD